VLEAFNIGLESTAGTGVAADKRILSYTLSPGIEIDAETQKSAGRKFAADVAPGAEHTTYDISGPMQYTDVIYPLSMTLGNPVVAQIGTSSAYRFTFTPDLDGPDTLKTYTLESGSASRAQKSTYVHGTGWGFKFAKQGVIEDNATLVGQEIDEGITLSSTLTDIPLEPIAGDHFEVWIDTTSGGLGGTKLTNVLEGEVNLSDLYKQVFTVDGSEVSYRDHVENPDGKGEIKLKMVADSVAMAYLTTLRAGDKLYIRIKATGPALDGSNYEHQTDACVHVIKPDKYEDSDGVYAIGLNFELAHDSTWGKAIEVQVVNAQTAL
jgi:hypothetical protein